VQFRLARCGFRRAEVIKLRVMDVPGGERDLGKPDSPPAGQAASEPAQDLNPLQRLIRQRLDEQGWSYGDVAKRGGLPRSTLYTLANNRNLARPPRPVTLNGLAWGLDLPVSVIRSAAAASTGLHYYDDQPDNDADPGASRPGGSGGAGSSGSASSPGSAGPMSDPERELLIASIDELTAEDRRHVAALVQSLRKKAGGERPGR
jgi:hypothetical protein